MGLTKLIVRGARQHNLKNISVEIPRNTLTVITGLSGSGKSSLAFDTIYAEGQRRYVESLSAYARQFLDQMERPEVDVIEGLSPSIAIEQKTTTRSPRSTVGTVTEIYDYLRVIYSSVGIPHCPNCGNPITRQSSEQIVQSILNGDLCKADDRIMILAPIVRGRKGAYRKELEKLAQDGYVRARVNGELVQLDEPPVLDKRKNHTNFHVHGYREEGTTTTPFDMTVLNDMDRFHLVMDVIDRLPKLGEKCAYLKQEMQDLLIHHREYINKEGLDMPEVLNWKWE